MKPPSVQSIIKPKAPKVQGWIQGEQIPELQADGYPRTTWIYPERGLRVISAVEVVRDPHDIHKGPEYHVSVSRIGPSRCSSNDAKFVRRCFDIMHADEDNHVPGGFVRNFWQPVGEKFIGHVCPCKDEEPAMREDKGDFVWRGITR